MDYKDNPRVHIDADGTMYVDGVEVRVKEVVFEDKKSMTAAYRDLKNSFDLGAIGAEEFYSELEILRDFYLAEGSAAWWNYTKKILSYEQSLQQAQQQIIDDKINRLGAMYSLGMISAKQYYQQLSDISDRYFENGSEGWAEYTQKIAELYNNLLDDANNDVEKLTDRLWGNVMQSVTIKRKDGQPDEHFYRLAPLSDKDTKKFFEGYNFLQENGAPSFLTDQYLSMSKDEASQLYGLLKGLGQELPAYFSKLSESRNETVSMSRNLFGTDVLARAVADIIESLKNSGFTKDIDINQNFYGSTVSPAEAAREAVNALKLQGVEI